MSRKTKIFIFLGILLAIVASFFIIIVSMRSEVVPDIYAFSNSNNKALAIKLGYEWNSFNGTIKNDALELKDVEYKNENMLLALPGERITIKNSEKSSLCYKFYQESFKYYDKSNNEVIVSFDEDNLYKESKYLEFTAPETEGTYIYNFTLNYYNKGTVTYAIKVVVSSAPTYDVEKIIEYKNTKLTDAANVGNILKNLPYSKYMSGYVLRVSSKPYELIINYEELSTSKTSFENSSIALFALIDGLELITYKLSDITYMFSKEEIENLVQRELSEYVDNKELWKKEVIFKEKEQRLNSHLDIYKSIIHDILSEFESNNENIIAIDLNTFEQGEDIKLTNVEKRELLEFCMINSSIVYEYNSEEFIPDAVLVRCVEILKEEENYYIKIEVTKKGKKTENTYLVRFIEDKWTVEEM